MVYKLLKADIDLGLRTCRPTLVVRRGTNPVSEVGETVVGRQTHIASRNFADIVVLRFRLSGLVPIETQATKDR